MLTAERIPARIVAVLEETGPTWALEVPEHADERARVVLATWEAENVRAPTPEVPELTGPRSVAGLATATIILVAHAATVLGPWPAAAWLGRGSAESRAIFAGEGWRCVTALTLHADLGHVIGNAIALAFFGNAAGRALGPGLLAAALVLAGAGGNLANAWYQESGHDSIGASTAVFATVGLLCGRALRVGRWSRHTGLRRLAPIGAGMAILAMIGVGGLRTDVGAHAFGLAVGTGLGLLLALASPRRPPPRLQLALGLAAAGAVIACWTAAIRWG